MTHRNVSQPLTDEQVEPGSSGDPGAPDYAFEGYSVEFLDKVALMPVNPAARPQQSRPAHG
jgi:hypothetical protein